MMSPRFILLSIAVAVSVVLGSGFVLYLAGVIRPARPLFVNKYSQLGDRGILPRWVQQPPTIDKTGNVLLFDLDLNIVLIFLSSSGEPVQFDSQLRPYAASFNVRTWPQSMKVVPQDGNSLIILRDGGGAIMRYELPTEATVSIEQELRRMKWNPDDLLDATIDIVATRSAATASDIRRDLDR